MKTSSIYSMKRGGVGSVLSQVVDQLKAQTNLAGSHSFLSKDIAGRAISMESMSSVDTNQFGTALESLKTTVEQIQGTVFNSMGLEGYTLTESQRSAALVGGVISANPMAYAARKNVMPQSSEFDRVIDNHSGIDRLGMEAYDEKENRQAAVYTIAYNMQAARQDEFGEALFPTIVVTPDQAGYRIAVDLVTIVDDIRRQITGAVDDFNRRNIIYAVRDASILQNNQTDLVPVYRTGNAANVANFVSSSLLATRTVTVGTESVTTSALAFGKKLSLLGLSQSDALVAAGLQDLTDAVDTAVTLDALYLKVTGIVSSATVNEVIRLKTAELPFSAFNYAVQGQVRLMNLNFRTESLRIADVTTQAGGAASVLLAPIVSGHYSVRLAVNVNGSVDLQTSTTELTTGDVHVVSITDNTGITYAADDAAVSAIAALFTGATMVGYDLGARRTNSNRRQRGQLLDTITYQQTYNVPLLSPITIPRPLGQGDQTDSSDLAALITTTRIRASNAAVTELLRVAEVLDAYVNAHDNAFDTVEVLGVGRYLVTPVFNKDSINFLTAIDSIASHQRAEDIQAVLVNKIRDMAYQSYRDSGYKAAADALNGGVAPVPTVIVATDPVLARYINVTGDLRTLGNEFQVKIVSSLDTRVAGKIFVTFGDPKAAADSGTPNPLQFGNMAWKPEMTLVLPLHRNGGNSKELVVQPSFLHVTNLPVLNVITVTNLPEVVAKKVAIYNHPV